MPDSPDKISEEKIIYFLQQRDKKAMEFIYDRYSAALFGIILRIVKSEEVGKNVLQETFIKVWQKFPSFNPERGRLFTWMLNIARNHAIDTVRSKSYRISFSQHVDYADISDNTLHSTVQKIDHIGLKEVVSKLENKYREVIDLIYFNGYTQSEVAEELGIPLGTVKSRVKIAIRILRTDLL